MSCKRDVSWSWPLVLGALLVSVGCDEPTASDGGADGGASEVDGSQPSEDVDASPAADGGVDAAVPPGDDGGAGPDSGTEVGGDAGDAAVVPEAEPLEIAGRWHSSWGGTEAIDSDGFTAFGSTARVARYDNDDNFMITQNPADAAWDPSKYNKVVWTELVDGSFYYCTIAFGARTAKAAVQTVNVADPSSPETGGCGGFAWTKLSPVLEIEGRWHSNWGGYEELDSDGVTSWGSTSTIAEYDNADNFMITQNPPSDLWSPNKFNKIVWTELEHGQFFYCFVDFGLDTAEDARNTTLTADASDPRHGGCGGFPWTRLSEPLEIEGRWHSHWGGIEILDSEGFTSYGSTSKVASYRNGSNSMITRNPASDPFNPKKYNKLVWTEPAGGSFHYCIVDFGLDTYAAAKASTMTADADDLAAGCGGFSWTALSRPIAIEGRWSDGTDVIAIDSDAWDDATVISYGATSAITQNSAGGADPALFNQVVWEDLGGGQLAICYVSQSEATADAATSNAGVALASDLATGCQGGAWTVLDAVAP
jgi:hypothetical protein